MSRNRCTSLRRTKVLHDLGDGAHRRPVRAVRLQLGDLDAAPSAIAEPPGLTHGALTLRLGSDSRSLTDGDSVQGMAAEHAGVLRGGPVAVDAADTATGAVVVVRGKDPLGHTRITNDEGGQRFDHCCRRGRSNAPADTSRVPARWPHDHESTFTITHHHRPDGLAPILILDTVTVPHPRRRREW